MLKHGILGLLNYKDMTGYTICTIFENSLQFFWRCQTSQVYRELHTLKKNGWITMKKIEQSDKPNKNMCHITEDGRHELIRWLETQDWKSPIRNPMLMQVFFLGNCNIDDNIKYFEKIVKDCTRAMSEFEYAEAGIDLLAKTQHLEDESVYWKMTAEFGRLSYQAFIDWANNCIKVLQDIKGRENENSSD